MIVCPSCQHYALEGMIFCLSCGTRLVYDLQAPEGKTRQPISDHFSPSITPEGKPGSSHTEHHLAILIEEYGILLPLETGKEYTLGRISGDQPIMPDIDLTPYRAYEQGVSRLHATLKTSASDLTVTDLGSANGSRVNGQKIPAHEPLCLADGDILALGKLKLQILIRR